MANYFDQFDAPGGTRLYSPNPDAPSSYGAPDTNGLVPPPAAVPAPQGNYFDRFDAPPDRSMGERATRLLTAIPQGINSGLYQGVMALPEVSGWIARHLGLTSSPDTPSPSQAIWNAGNAARDNLGVTYTPNITPENAAERTALATGEAIGNVASSAIPGGIVARTAAPLAAITPATEAERAAASLVPGFKTAVPTYGQTVAKTLAANPVAQTAFTAAGNIVGNETDNPYLGMATSLALPAIAHVGQRTVAAAPATDTQEAERRAVMDFGRQNGLGPLTAGKILNSPKLQVMESAATKTPVPFLGRSVAGTEMANRNSFQKLALEKAGTYGQTAATPGVKADTADRIGQGFEPFKQYTLNVDPQLNSGLDAVEKRYTKQFMASIEPGLMDRIDELRSGSAPGNLSATIDGETFQNLRSDLSALSAKGGKSGRAAGQLVGVLDDWAERQLPSDVVGDYRTARQQWRNYLAIEKATAANNDQTARGNFSVADYNRAARNNPDIARLGQYGTMFVGDKMPNTSGTASHNMAQHAMGLGGLTAGYAGLHELGVNPLHSAMAIGAFAVPALVERAINNPATRAALLARYRYATPSFVTPSLYSATAADALRAGGGGG